MGRTHTEDSEEKQSAEDKRKGEHSKKEKIDNVSESTDDYKKCVKKQITILYKPARITS